MANLIVNRIYEFLMLLTCVYIAYAEDSTYNRDNMSVNADYLINLNTEILQAMEKSNPIVIHYLKFYIKYVKYLLNKTETASLCEMKTLKHFYKNVTRRPTFLFTLTDFNKLQQRSFWNNSVVEEYHYVMKEAKSCWGSLTGLLLQYYRDKGGLLSESGEVETCC